MTMQSDTPRPDTPVSGGDELVDRLRARVRKWASNSSKGSRVTVPLGELRAVLAALTPAADRAVVAGSCVLCAGKCRSHRLGHPEDWEPEAGSHAYVPPAPTDAQAGMGER